MKRIYTPALFVFLFIAGCGVDWFPTTTSTTPTTPAAPSLVMAYVPGGVLASNSANPAFTTSNLNFMIVNSSGSPAQSGLGFTAQLDSSLAVTAASAQCGGTVSISGAKITFAGGSLAANTAGCTITAVVTGANTGITTNTITTKAADITGLTGLHNSASDQTLKVFPVSFPISFNGGTVTVNNINSVPAGSGGGSTTYTVTVDGTNDTLLDANVTATVVAVDINGVDIPSTVTPAITVTGVVSAGSTTPVQLAALPSVPDADAARIQFWRITAATAQ